jgi:hypothetical protein
MTRISHKNKNNEYIRIGIVKYPRQRLRVCCELVNTAEPRYNAIGLCDTSSIASDILWYQLLDHC